MSNESKAREAEWHALYGPWPRHCVQRAFVEGMSWWQFHKNGSTAFASEREEAEDEAVRRYGEPSAQVSVPLPLAQRILAALEREAETSFHKRKLAAVIEELREVLPK